MTIIKPDVITDVWCATGTVGTDYIIPVKTSIDPDIMTQDTGIPISMETPLNAGGVPVSRPETNGYMRLYSSFLAWLQAGGTFTFEPAVSAANGGYPIGTVLWAESKNDFVVSLIANNTFDFVTTPSYIDGIKWQAIGAAAFPDITDTAGLVSITGAGGLFVTGVGGIFVSHDVDIAGTLEVNGVAQFISDVLIQSSATFVDDTLGPRFAFIRSTNTLPNTYTWFFDSEADAVNIPGATKMAFMALQDGINDIALAATYNQARWYMPLATPGAQDPTVHTHALAMLGDLVHGFPSTPFVFPDLEIRVNNTTTFPTANGISLSGHLFYPPALSWNPGVTVLPISLINAGIIIATRGYNSFGTATGGIVDGILATVEFDGTNLIFNINNTTGSPLDADIYFSIEI